MRSFKRLVITATAALAVMAIPSPANAAVIFSGPGSFAAGYTTPVTVVPAGGSLQYVNGDIASHNVIAFDAFLSTKLAKKTPWCKGYPKGKCPVFWSETIPASGATAVEGLENLRSGTQYTFFCSVHPGMKGTLVAL